MLYGNPLGEITYPATPSLTWLLKMLHGNSLRSLGLCKQKPPVYLHDPAINLSLLQTLAFQSLFGLTVHQAPELALTILLTEAEQGSCSTLKHHLAVAQVTKLTKQGLFGGVKRCNFNNEAQLQGKMGLFQECRVIRSVADSQGVKKWLIHSMWVI